MEVTWISRTGGRAVNEDAVSKSRAKGIFCAVVADGLGGHKGGQLASSLAVGAIIDSFEKNPGFSQEHLRSYIESGKDAVSAHALSDPDLLHMSSTAAVLLIRGRRAMWANVGDTRLYKFSGGEISDVTEDHSVAFSDFVRGDIEYDMIRTSPQRNRLTSAIGVNMDSINFSGEHRIDASTSFLMCTDGWWEYVKETDMENTLSDSETAEAWLEKMLKIREENAPADSDNFTAAVIII